MDIAAILAEIDTEIERLQKIRTALAPAGEPVKRGRGRPKGSVAKVTKKGRRTLSPEARAKIAAAQKARWAKTKKNS